LIFFTNLPKVVYNSIETTYGIISNNGNIACIGNNVKDEFNMENKMFDLMVHPIRLRIVTAMSNDRMTAKEIADALPDIPQTTLYRHINVLIEGGLLEVVEEIPQRGTVERVLGFKVQPTLQPQDLLGLSKEQLKETFTMVIYTLLNEALNSLNQFPEGKPIDIIGSGFHFSECQLNLTDEEYHQLNQKIMGLMMEAGNNKPTQERKRRIFSYMFIPLKIGGTAEE
jgi:DNA-binding transcriptional ArsR family regulator